MPSKNLSSIQNSKFNIQHSTFNIQNSKFKIQHSTFKIQNSTFKIQHSKFNIQNSTFISLLLLVLVLTEAGTAVWRHTPIQPSADPVFSYPEAAAQFGKSPDLAPALRLYRADRAAECKLVASDSSRLTVFYFEWDEVRAGPVMELAGHPPEACNMVAGLQLREVAPVRCFNVSGQAPLVFDCTRFTNPAGRDVFMFKLAWIQGLGSRQFREVTHRPLRIKNSFLRHTGAARVLQAGVFDARDADHAWQVFRSEVLDKLEWKG